MPVTLNIDKDKNIVYGTFSQVVSIEEHLEAMENISKDPHYRPDINEIIDFSNCTAFLKGFDDMQKLINKEDSLCPPSMIRKCAIIGQNKSIFGMMRMYEILTDQKGIKVRFIDSIEDAEKWILEDKI